MVACVPRPIRVPWRIAKISPRSGPSVARSHATLCDVDAPRCLSRALASTATRPLPLTEGYRKSQANLFLALGSAFSRTLIDAYGLESLEEGMVTRPQETFDPAVSFLYCGRR